MNISNICNNVYNKSIMVVIILGISLLLSFIPDSTNYAEAQDQPQLATFREHAQILIDEQLTNNITASISLQSTSNKEIKFPDTLRDQILIDKRILSVILTNEDQCVLGVIDEACIMINLEKDPDWPGIIAIQNGAREIGDQYIDALNKVFDTDAEFHSVFVHHKDESNILLDTSGHVSGKGTISAVYTMPLEDTDSMYQKISAILLSSEIRNAGGFYQTALDLSNDINSKMSFSIIPQNGNALYQLKLSTYYPNLETIDTPDPLKYLKTDRLQRSEYFSDNFYPLNSLLQIVILSDEPKKISKTNSDIISTQLVDGEQIPIEITKPGWIFDPMHGSKIQGKYIFGKEFFVDKKDLMFVLSPSSELILPPQQDNNSITMNNTNNNNNYDDSYIVLPIIVIVAIGISIYYLKGYKKKSE